MAARIVNHLKPDEEGSLYGSVAEAAEALADMLGQFSARGFVTETEDRDEGPWYTVKDENGESVGIFYILVDV